MTRRPLIIASGILIGAGLGGFLDSIVFQRIFQIHNMLSATIPPDTYRPLMTTVRGKTEPSLSCQALLYQFGKTGSSEPYEMRSPSWGYTSGDNDADV
jgi:hypothetical protein